MSEPQRDPPEATPPLIEATPAERRADVAAASGRPLLIAAVAVLAVVSVGIATSPFWAPPLATVLPWSPRTGAEEIAGHIGDVDHRATTLAQQQAAIGERLTRLEQQVKTATAAAPQQAALEQRLAALEQRLGAVAQHQGETEQQSERFQQQASSSYASLRDEVEKLAAAQQRREASEKEKGPDGTDQALLLSLEPLRNAVESGRPFAPQLAAMTALAHDRAEVKDALKPLENPATKGIPDKLALARRFDEAVAPAMLRAAAQPREDSWSERVWSGLRSLVVIRRVDGTGTNADDPTEAAVAQAEKALAANDLAGAVKAVEAVNGRATGPVQSASATWLAAARERVAAETALATISQQLTARLAAGGEPPQPR
ncbi:MAG TPA: hypothetical protein VGU20_02530 [Stellaceae bacterium]|nr:hypothetical protein [Stellaceae bacterium]